MLGVRVENGFLIVGIKEFVIGVFLLVIWIEESFYVRVLLWLVSLFLFLLRVGVVYDELNYKLLIKKNNCIFN